MNPTTRALAPTTMAQRYRAISSRIAPWRTPVSRRAASRRGGDRSGIHPSKPAVARPPARQHRLPRGQARERHEPAGGRVRGEELREPQHPVGATIALDTPAIGLQRPGEIEAAVDDLLHQLAALAAEVERGPDTLGGERHALPARVADREEATHRGPQQPAGEGNPVIGGGGGADVGEEALEGGLELGEPR